MKVAVTGVSGHVGYVTHLNLKKLGIERRYLLREPAEHLLGEDCVAGSLSSEKALEELVQGCTTVIHIAGIVWASNRKNQMVYEVNFEGTKRLFEIAKKNGVEHFIYISSIHAFQETKNSVLDETIPLCVDETVSYNFSKAASERYLNQQTEMKITILNPTAIIGAGDFYLNGMNQIFQKIETKKLPMVVEGGYNIVDVKDVAKAIVYAAQNQIEGKFLLGGNYITMKELAQRYGEVNQLKVTNRVLKARWMKLLANFAAPFERFFAKPIALNPYAVATLLEAHQNISSEKAKAQLHLTQQPIENTLRDIHQWLNHKTIEI